MNTEIQEDELHLTRLNKRLAYPRELTEHVEKERLAAQKRIQERRSVTSELRRVPQEIWTGIFSAVCVEGVNSFDKDYSFPVMHGESSTGQSDLRPPSVLSRVSCHWREIVTHCPRLWSTLRVALDDYRSGIIAPLATHLRMTGEYPLQMTILCGSVLRSYRLSHVYNRQNTTAAICNIVFPHIWRCQILEFESRSYSGMPLVDWHSIGGSAGERRCPAFPYLRELSVKIPFDADEDSFQWLWEAASAALALTRLELSHPIAPANLPYHQLTELDIERVTILADFLNVLPACTSLRALTIRSWKLPVAETHSDTQNVVELPSLRRLAVIDTGLSGPNIDILFETVAFPCLHELDLESFQVPTIRGLRGPTGLSGSLYALRHLRLQVDGSWTPNYQREVAPVLQACPRITHLELEYGPWIAGNSENNYVSKFSSFFSHLKIDSMDPGRVLLPRLTHLLVYEASEQCLERTIVDMLVAVRSRNRTTGVSPLSACVFSWCTKITLRERCTGGCSGPTISEVQTLVREFGLEDQLRCVICHAEWDRQSRRAFIHNTTNTSPRSSVGSVRPYEVSL
ncbi:hypothetical protein PM082_006378 [Marasmius tenuissimus]|nr:hypothetical protein PM082_006378 [Marasmius tenuissimus]